MTTQQDYRQVIEQIRASRGGQGSTGPPVQSQGQVHPAIRQRSGITDVDFGLGNASMWNPFSGDAWKQQGLGALRSLEELDRATFRHVRQPLINSLRPSAITAPHIPFLQDAPESDFDRRLGGLYDLYESQYGQEPGYMQRLDIQQGVTPWWAELATDLVLPGPPAAEAAGLARGVRGLANRFGRAFAPQDTTHLVNPATGLYTPPVESALGSRYGGQYLGMGDPAITPGQSPRYFRQHLGIGAPSMETIPPASARGTLPIGQGLDAGPIPMPRQQQATMPATAPITPEAAPVAPQPEGRLFQPGTPDPNNPLTTIEQRQSLESGELLELQRRRREAGIASIPEASPSPSPGPAAQPLRSARGQSTTAHITNKGDMDFEMQVVDLDDPGLQVSHDPFTFEENPRYPQELQPRDRSSREMQTNQIAMRTNLDPDDILNDYRSVDRGQPIIGPDGVVESGNGRLMALRGSDEAYERYKPTLERRAAEFGINPEQLSQFKRPALVRVRSGNMTPEQRLDFVRGANRQTTAQMTGSETAMTDAGNINPQMLAHVEDLDVGIDDLLLRASSRDFINDFVGKLPPAERTTMTQGGILSQAGRTRLKNAIFARVFGQDGAPIIQRFFESTEGGVVNVQRGISSSVPKLLVLRRRVERGELPEELDISGPLSDALRQITAIVDRGESGRLPVRVSDYLAQSRMGGDDSSLAADMILSIMGQSTRSSRGIAETLDNYLTRALARQDSGTALMPGMEDLVTGQDRLSMLRESVPGNVDQEQISRLFDFRQSVGRDPATVGGPTAIGGTPFPTRGVTGRPTLGQEFATNRNLEMPMGSGRAETSPLADPAQLGARQERQDLLTRGQQDMFGSNQADEVVRRDTDAAVARVEQADDPPTQAVTEIEDAAKQLKSDTSFRAVIDELRAPTQEQTQALRLDRQNKPTIVDRITQDVVDQIKKPRVPRARAATVPDPLPTANSAEDTIDLMQFWPNKNTVQSLAVRRTGKIDLVTDKLARLELDLKPFYEKMGVRKGHFARQDTDQMMRVLEGKADPSTLPTDAMRGYVRTLRTSLDDLEEGTYSFLDWAENNGMDEFFATSIPELRQRMDSIKQTGLYLPHHWKDVAQRRGRGQGRALRFTRERKYATYDEGRSAGLEPAYDDPFYVIAQERFNREKQVADVSFLKQLRDLGFVVKREELPQGTAGWRVPEGAGPWSNHAVPNWVADYIDLEHNVRWHWNIPDFVPGLGGKDAYVGYAKMNNNLKAWKFVLAMGQGVDFMLRRIGFGVTSARHGYHRNFKGMEQSVISYFKGIDARTDYVLNIAHDTSPVIPARAGINHRAYIENGLAGADKAWFVSVENDALPGLFQRATRGMSLPIRVITGATDWFRDGMFQSVYRVTMINYMDNISVPTQIRRHPDWNDQQIMQEAARITNLKFSSPQNWDRMVFASPKLEQFLRASMISWNEAVSWPRMFFEAIPVPVYRDGRWQSVNTNWREFSGAFLGLLTSIAAISTLLNLPSEEGRDQIQPENYIPVRTTPYSPIGIEYNPEFASPNIPGLKGRGGRNIRVDLVGQADTAFRILDPTGYFLSRLAVGNRAFQNQLQAKNFFGEEITGWKRLFQGIEDISPMVVGGILQGTGQAVPGASNFIPEGEARLGATGLVLQSTVGVNLRTEGNPDLRDRYARESGLPSYQDAEPYQKKEVRQTIKTQAGDELAVSAEEGARRGQEWSKSQNRLNELEEEHERRLTGLAQQAGMPSMMFGGGRGGRTRTRQLVSQYYDMKREMATRRDEVRRTTKGEFPESDSPNVQALDGYYGLIDQAKDDYGNFEMEEYNRLRDAYWNTLRPEQRSYILRNTNTTPLPPPLMNFLRRHATKEYESVMASQQARARHR